MRKQLALALVTCVLALELSPSICLAAESTILSQETKTASSFTPSDLDSRQTAAQSLVDQQNAVITIQVTTTPALPDSTAIAGWLDANQSAYSTGLLSSHPDDTGFIYHEGIQQPWAVIYQYTQAYTYDQALAGISFVNQKDIASAKQILDFFYNEWQNEGANFEGFWTVYNTDPNFQWKRYEWRKGMGENAWIALFALRYATSQKKNKEEAAKARALAVAITKWIGTLPHFEGAVAMGEENPSIAPNWGRIISTENNLDYFALLREVQKKATKTDKELFKIEYDNLRNWFKTQAFNPETGLFRRGGLFDPTTSQIEWDGLESLDVNSWALSAVGPKDLEKYFDINLEAFIARIGESFSVQDNGAFGGDILTAQGFDFSNAVNASLIGRQGMTWVEGTNQMVLAYKLVRDYFKSRRVGAGRSINRLASERLYSKLIDQFILRNADSAVWEQNTLSFLYATLAGAQIFFGTPNWVTSPGRAVSSAAWVYFALNKINPFKS